MPWGALGEGTQGRFIASGALLRCGLLQLDPKIFKSASKPDGILLDPKASRNQGRRTERARLTNP